MKRRGLTLLEVMLAAFILAVALGQLVWALSFANRSTLDAYYENLALSLAREPLEIFKGKGYAWTREYLRKPGIPWYPLEPVRIRQEKSWVGYPVGAEDFYRDISIREETVESRRCLKVVVQVFPAPGAKAMVYFSRKAGVSLEALLFEDVP